MFGNFQFGQPYFAHGTGISIAGTGESVAASATSAASSTLTFAGTGAGTAAPGDSIGSGEGAFSGSGSSTAQPGTSGGNGNVEGATIPPTAGAGRGGVLGSRRRKRELVETISGVGQSIAAPGASSGVGAVAMSGHASSVARSAISASTGWEIPLAISGRGRSAAKPARCHGAALGKRPQPIINRTRFASMPARFQRDEAEEILLLVAASIGDNPTEADEVAALVSLMDD